MSRPPSPSKITGNWFVRMFKGWLCRRRLDRHDVSPLVHALYDHGENYAALTACEQMQYDQPQNVYAYVHAIDLAMRCHRNFKRAQRSLTRGREVLHNAHERDLLECFYLYVTSTIWLR